MEHLERLAKVMRYAGLNLTPQILQVVLDKNVRELVDELDAKLAANPNLDLESIDVILEAIQEKAVKQEALEQEKAAKKSAKKPALEKA